MPTVAEAMKPTRAYELLLELQNEMARMRADNFVFQQANKELREQLQEAHGRRYQLEEMIARLMVRLGEE